MASNRTVLVIDDEIHIRRVIEVKLKNSGYRVLTSGNGEEGLKMLLEHRPDAVVTDINMPGMDGKTLCQRSNLLKESRPFLTIVVTARILPDEHEWIEQMRDTVFMEKPFSPSKLAAAVDRYFEGEPHE